MKKAFRFKQFELFDDLTAMKIGTDAILLGAWANVENTESILDIGTGSGIIALMLAQRSEALIDAVEIDKKSAQQALDNFNLSSWKEKMKVINTSFQAFVNATSEKYDLIVSNPPYFRNALKSTNPDKNLARHSDSLSIEELIEGISELLSPEGKACIILPVNESIYLKKVAELKGLYCSIQTEIISRKGLAPKRMLMEFCKEKKKLKTTTLIILNEDLTYTEEFNVLTKDFYLNF